MITMMIETNRLLLKRVSLNDIDIFGKMLSDKDITCYLPKGAPYTPEEIQAYVADRCNHWANGFGTYVIMLRSNPEIKIGYVGIELVSGTQHRDIRYGILQEYSGKGYAFEASERCLAHYFESGLGNKVFGVVFPANKASVHILEKLGMYQDKTVNLYDDNNLATYSITV